MLQVAVNQAKSQLSALIHAVEEGQDVVLTRHGKPVVRMVRETTARLVVSREQQMQEALVKLHAFQALVKPDPNYVKGDWKQYRDEGRQ